MEVAYETEFPNEELENGIWTRNKIRRLHPEGMTTDEFDNYMAEFGELLKGEGYSRYIGPVSDFQTRFMNRVLQTYKENSTASAEVKHITAEIIRYLIDESESGNSIFDGILNESIARKVENELRNEFYDMLLDWEVYQERNGTWTVDCMFGGNYCPWWDGWNID